MAYTPTQWETGDIITAEKLNKAEQGIAAANPVFIPVTYDEAANAYVLGASYNELKALVGKVVIGIEEYPDDPATYLCYYKLFTQLSIEDGTYTAQFFFTTISGGQYVPAIQTFSSTDPDENMKAVLS